MNIYLAGSFAYQSREKTEARKKYLANIAAKLRLLNSDKTPFVVYSPSELKIENAWDMSMYDWGNAVYQHDLHELQTADVIVLISFGKENNSGAVWEAGYACGINKPVILVSQEDNASESLMLVHSCTAHVVGESELIKYLLESVTTNDFAKCDVKNRFTES